MQKDLFKHRYAIRVRNYEVDWQGIVHNGNYLLYCEVGRVEYLKHIGAALDLNSVNTDSKVVLVRNEIDYRKPATFGEELSILTRISFVKNTSFAMEGMLIHPDGETVAENIAYHVWLDPATNRPGRVPDSFRALVRAFEGADCTFLDDPKAGKS